MQIDKIRDQFPFLEQKPTPVYLDNASTTQKPRVVIDAVSEYYKFHNGNPGRGNHRLAREAEEVYESARAAVARFIHAASIEEIIFTRNTTESINLLAYTLADQIQTDDVIVLTQMEHHSNLLPWLRLAQQKNARVEYIPVNAHGALEWPDKLRELQDDKVKILSITHASNVLGTINPVRKIVEQAKNSWPGIVTVVDAAQSTAHTTVNIDHLKCDFLAFSGHKIYGPMGIGVLYGKKALLGQLEPYQLGGGMVNHVDWNSYEPRRSPTRFEAGTVNVAGAAGLQAAIEFVEKVKIEEIADHERALTDYLLIELKNSGINGLQLYGWPIDYSLSDLSNRIGFVSLNISGIHAEDLANFLDDDSILVRAGDHCTIPLHHDVLKTDSTLRISLGIYNTKEEIDRLVDSLQRAVKLLMTRQ